MCHARRHAAGPSPWLFDLNGMYGTAPTASIAARFACPTYALSALTSATSNRLAVVATRPGSSGESFALLSVTSTLVITFVQAPTIAWHLIHRCWLTSRPYL